MTHPYTRQADSGGETAYSPGCVEGLFRERRAWLILTAIFVKVEPDSADG
jgi:hypothetical protein